MLSMTEQTAAIIQIIQSIPEGEISSYGTVAKAAAPLVPHSPPGARQVARILHTCTKKYNLPWQRVVGAQKKILLPKGGGFEEQIIALRSEGVEVTDEGKIRQDFYRFGMAPKS